MKCSEVAFSLGSNFLKEIKLKLEGAYPRMSLSRGG